MNMRKNFDISAYLVVGPENTLGRPVADVIRAAVANGFTCLQIRSKTASARNSSHSAARRRMSCGNSASQMKSSCSSTTGSMSH